VRLRRQTEESLIIPTLSLINLGDEKRVITRLKDGSFAPKLVKTGASSRGETAVTDGLSEGDEVVVSGLFLIDSEANLSGALERMRRPDAPPAQSEPQADPSAQGEPKAQSEPQAQADPRAQRGPRGAL
jgi:Cu(I)/Ag(I) efflux system membrane fusion protein